MSAHNHDEEIIKRIPLKRGGAQAQGWKPSGGNIKPIESDTECPEINLTEAKSMEQAMHISLLNSIAFTLDEEYLQKAAERLHAQASHYDATAVLNRSWSREGGNLMNEQARCLQLLADYIKSNKRITGLKAKLDKVNNLQKQFADQFGI